MMKYFRYYPWGLQFFLFLLMVITIFSFANYTAAALIPKMAGVSLSQLFEINEKSPYWLVKTAVLTQGALSLSIFLIPALLFSYLTHPDALSYAGLNKPKKAIQPLLAMLLMLSAIPLLELVQALVSHLPFDKAIRDEQAASEKTMMAYLTMYSPADFVRSFIVMALIPAVGEELFFRGVLMRFTQKASKNMFFSISFTSAMFAFSHSNVFGMFSIFLAGVLLACVYYLTNSLWCSILAHMTFNGTQVVLMYLANSSERVKSFANSKDSHYGLIIACALVFTGTLLLINKYKTPMANDWTDDFKDEPAIPGAEIE